jgi:hypothetical protein
LPSEFSLVRIQNPDQDCSFNPANEGLRATLESFAKPYLPRATPISVQSTQGKSLVTLQRRNLCQEKKLAAKKEPHQPSLPSHRDTNGNKNPKATHLHCLIHPHNSNRQQPGHPYYFRPQQWLLLPEVDLEVDVVEETVVAVADSHRGAAVADLHREVVIVVDVVSFNPALRNWALNSAWFSVRDRPSAQKRKGA